MIMSIEKSSPIKNVELRSEASVDFGGMVLIVADYNLVTHERTCVSGKDIDSHFSGDLYFTDEPPAFIQERLVMTHERSQIVLNQVRIFALPDDISKANSALRFGITFSYATKNTDG